MEVLELARCYFWVWHNSNKKTSGLKAVVTDEEESIIQTFSRGYKSQNAESAEISGIKYIIELMERLEADGSISEDSDVIIYGSSRDLIEAVKYGDIMGAGNFKGMGDILLEFQWHKNWRLVWKQTAKEEFESISEQNLRRKATFGGQRKGKPSKKSGEQKVVNIVPIRELTRGKDLQLIFFDLEMNCNDNSRRLSGCEIISIGAVKYRKSHGVEEDGMFYSLVRPTVNPVLSETCMDITGLEQEAVNRAANFNEVFNNFKDWVGNLENSLFISWSDGDIRAIRRDYEINRSADRELYAAVNRNYTDFQLEFSEYMLSKNRISLKNALKLLKLDFIGQQHHAGYDALNMALLYEAYEKSGEGLAETAVSRR
ncbi:MAG: exonuclease domain-containing protein [Bacillota bacterium]|nr:exonuclease domain-containing protein [Bacillota bacterium]